MNNDQHNYFFEHASKENNVLTNKEMLYICTGDSDWHEIILQFAVFLDEVGYVGVYDKVSYLLENDNN